MGDKFSGFIRQPHILKYSNIVKMKMLIIIVSHKKLFINRSFNDRSIKSRPKSIVSLSLDAE